MARVSCRNCGQEWGRNPVLEVPCSSCRAPVGTWCRRPSGHRAMDLHRQREELAMERGLLHRCPAAQREGEQLALWGKTGGKIDSPV
ncbi:MAG: hypothetical protein Q8R28_22240 [Dehalococcoidia bacterium]|nr:hypothetical protein [Dehalococcoidia bacterium]